MMLPKDNSKVCSLIEFHASREEDNTAWKRLMWLIAEAFLNGVRELKLVDASKGKIQTVWLTKDKKLPMQVTNLLSKVNRALGVMKSMDFRPHVDVLGASSLAAIRDKAAEQAILDSAIDDEALETAVDQFLFNQVYLGCSGIVPYVYSTADRPVAVDFCVIHPRELLPFPSIGYNLSQQQGILWQRWLPIEKVEELFNKGRKFSKEQIRELDCVAKPFGEWPTSPADTGAEGVFGSAQLLNPDTLTPQLGGPNNHMNIIVKVRTLWMWDKGGVLKERVICSGKMMLERVKYDGGVHRCPLGVARFYENGSFYGAGMFDLLYSMEKVLEQTIRDLVTNIKELDNYGFLVIPGGQFNTRQAFNDKGRGLRIVEVNPKANFDGQRDMRPMQVTPHNSGDMPARVVDVLQRVIEGVSPVADLIQDKGRVDSLPGLQFLDEERKKPLVGPVASVQRAFGTIYRAIALDTHKELVLKRASLPLKDLNINLAGVVIDFQTDTATFAGAGSNPIPRVSRLRYLIKSRAPGSEVVKKQEIYGMFSQQQIDWNRYVLSLFKENIDTPVWVEDERNAYSSIVRTILRLYNDGQTPGEIEFHPQFARPELQLIVLRSFMAGPVMAASSAQVQTAFIQLDQQLMESHGMMLPEAVPDPYDMAYQQQAQVAAMQQLQQQSQMRTPNA